MNRQLFTLLFRLFLAVLTIGAIPENAQAAVQTRQTLGGYALGYKLYKTAEDFAKVMCAGQYQNGDPLQFDGTIEYNSPPSSSDPHPQFYYWCKQPSAPYTSSKYGPSLTWAYACPDSQNLSATPPICTVAANKPPCQCNKQGDPISMAEKEASQVEMDYRSAQGLEFVRYYSSRILPQSQESLPQGWRHSYSKRLYSTRLAVNPASSGCTPGGLCGFDHYEWTGNNWSPYYWGTLSTDFTYIVRPDGYSYYFTSADGGHTWQGDSDVNYQLTGSQFDSNGNVTQWNLVTPQNDTETYDSLGRLVSIQFRNGRSQTLTYSDATTPATIAPQPNLLIQVADNFGRTLKFQYDALSRLAQMTDPAGQTYSYAYDSVNNMTSVTYPGGLTRQYLYNEPAYDADTDASANNLMTGINDELSAGNIVRFAILKYDNQGRPISAEHVTGVEKFTINYDASTFTDALGTARVYSYANVNGVNFQTSVSQPAGAGSSAALSTLAYDDNGNIQTRTDWNGNRTTYTYDLTRNLEIQRIEAAGTAQARTISTQWHGTYRLPLQIAEPKKITTYTYDASGNLLTRTEQATTDTNGSSGFNAAPTGSPRTWTYTYNSVGQVLTVTGPRTDLADKTTYAYDTSGNLISITDALGKVITLSNYDANGRVGHIVDPNGLVTDLTYSPRGWLLQKTVSGNGIVETTSYAYDGVGQPTQVTTPDSTITYTYDAAHRLTDIADSLGNTIHYTLDAMGNRTAEQTKDANGNLARQITRVYDALNRLQQVTGGTQ